MVAHRLWIPASAMTPDPAAAGNVYPKMSSIDDVNDRFPDELLAFKDSGTRIAAHLKIPVPKNYVYNVSVPPKIILVWYSNASSGDVVWDVDYKAVADGESFDPSTDDEALTITVTTPGTARLRKDSSLTLGNNLAPDDLLMAKIARDGVQSADTLATDAVLHGLFFEWSDA